MRTLALLTIGLLACAVTAPLRAAESATAGTANRVVEWTFTSAKTHADPFNEVTLDAVFTAPDGHESRVPAFWAGGGTWRVRYASPKVGVHRFKSVCSDAGDAGLHGVQGSIDIKPYGGDNPLYRHGPIRVAADKKHFEHADGTPFFWLADTWWMGLTKRLHWPADFKTLTDDRVGKGFTVVQIVAGLYPDMPAFDERGANEMGFPWVKPDYARINPQYFDAADRRIAHLADNGLAPCVVGAWGYHLPWLGVDRMTQHWRNVIARWGAYPVIWCTAGEAAMPYYLSAKKAEDAAIQKQGWTDIAKYIRETDPFDRLISIHPTDMARNQVTDPAALDFEMLQTGHGDRASIGPTINLVRASREAKPTMPTINSEVCYEGILGTCHADVQRIMAWTCLLGGTAGHTYGANGIWQVNRKEQVYGPSPHGGNWGTTPWDEAMRLPGSAQTGLAKKFLLQFDWYEFTPQADVATYDEAADEAPKWSEWIWHADGEANKGAPVAARFFRRTFAMPDGAKVKKAVLHLSVDDKFTAYVNGRRVGEHQNWMVPARYDVTKMLRPGRNVLAVRGENLPAPVDVNPAGLLCALSITLADGTMAAINSDAEWRSSADEAPDWSAPAFDDGGWKPANVVGKYGDPPWGQQLQSPDSTLMPFAAAIPGKVQVIYVPMPRSVRVTGLKAGTKYRAEYFDPVTGESSDAEPAAPDAGGALSVAPPEAAQDWVLVLRAP
jgi:hypothetical protein